MEVKIGVSNRHIHLSKEDLELLFGKGYQLKKIKDLSQKGNYACLEVVTVSNKDREIKEVRIVEPSREKTQLEISKTDAYYLGITPPCKNSGDLDNASEVTIKGPLGEIKRNAAIIPNRHIHMNFDEAEKLGFKNGDIVKVKLFGIKGGILDNVHIKVADNFSLELHLDLDDANSHLVVNGDIAEILKN